VRRRVSPQQRCIGLTVLDGDEKTEQQRKSKQPHHEDPMRQRRYMVVRTVARRNQRLLDHIVELVDDDLYGRRIIAAGIVFAPEGDSASSGTSATSTASVPVRLTPSLSANLRAAKSSLPKINISKQPMPSTKPRLGRETGPVPYASGAHPLSSDSRRAAIPRG